MKNLTTPAWASGSVSRPTGRRGDVINGAEFIEIGIAGWEALTYALDGNLMLGAAPLRRASVWFLNCLLQLNPHSITFAAEPANYLVLSTQYFYLID